MIELAPALFPSSCLFSLHRGVASARSVASKKFRLLFFFFISFSFWKLFIWSFASIRLSSRLRPCCFNHCLSGSCIDQFRPPLPPHFFPGALTVSRRVLLPVSPDSFPLLRLGLVCCLRPGAECQKPHFFFLPPSFVPPFLIIRCITRNSQLRKLSSSTRDLTAPPCTITSRSRTV